MKKIYSVTLLAALILSTLSVNCAYAEKLRALFGDGSVRYVSSGPVALSKDQNALIGLLLPAVRNAKASIRLIDNKGKTLLTKELTIPTDQIPTDQNEGFWGIAYTLSVSDNGVVTITDGTTPETIGDITTSEHVSVLIGLLLPAVQKVREAASRMHTGTVQIINKRTGDVSFILPFIEQSVVTKNIALGK